MGSGTGADVRVLPTTALGAEELRQLRSLLDEAFAGDFPDDDWEHCLGGWHVVVAVEGRPVSHAAVVHREMEVAGRRWRCGYVEGVGTAPRRQREGLGSLAMHRAGELIAAEFELGALATDVHPFYERHGWERWRGPTYVRHGPRLVRTEEEDDGIMVLRFGPSQDLSLSEAIACQQRAGDDW